MDPSTMATSSSSTNKVTILIATGLTFGIINTLSILTRTLSQLLHHRLSPNDIGMIFVLLTYFSLIAFLLLGARSGLGSHTLAVLTSSAPQRLAESMKWIFALELSYLFLTTVMKASVAITLLQWASTRLQRGLLYAAIAADCLVGTAVGVITLVQCAPLEFSWRRFEGDANVKGTCRDPGEIIRAGYALCVITVTLDMLFLALPLVMMRQHRPNPRVRLYIYGLLVLGVQASIANFIRIAALVKLGTYKDALYDAADVFLWSFIEVSLGITVAGLLELAPLLQRLGFRGFEEVNQGASGEFDKDNDVVGLVAVGKSESFDA